MRGYLTIDHLAIILLRQQEKKDLIFTKEEIESELECARDDLYSLEDDREAFEIRGLLKRYHEELEPLQKRVDMLRSILGITAEEDEKAVVDSWEEHHKKMREMREMIEERKRLRAAHNDLTNLEVVKKVYGATYIPSDKLQSMAVESNKKVARFFKHLNNSWEKAKDHKIIMEEKLKRLNTI